MTVNKLIRLMILLSLLLVNTACNADLHKVSGKVAMVGHDPFGFISIQDTKKVVYKIVGPHAKKLAREYQGRVVTLEGKVTKEAVGPGFPAEFTVVKIIR